MKLNIQIKGGFFLDRVVATLLFLAVVVTHSSAQVSADKSVADGVASEQKAALKGGTVAEAAVDTALGDKAFADSLDNILPDVAPDDAEEGANLHKTLKIKFIEGNAGFMSLVAMALILGLAFCIERIIFLTISEINTRQFMSDLEKKMSEGNIDEAVAQCEQTRGPVAAICLQGLKRVNDNIADIERAVASYGSVQAANLEKGCPWITLFIAMAPSLGFLGTVIGMVMAFDQIQMAGDISPTIVAAGMKVALLTTIFGIIVTLILQTFYNFILSKIDTIVSSMEESTITLLDVIMKYKVENESKA